jgi:hypothetical protein
MRRRIGFLFICSAAVPIAVFASTAWGCGALTTLSSTPKVAAPGQTIQVSGRNYGATPGNTPVQIRWNSRTGPALEGGESLVPAGGVITANVKVPANATPGWYVLNAVQFSSTTGAAKSGSPGRTTVRVQGSAQSSTTPFGATTPTGSGGSGSPDVPLPGILLSAALLATGLTLVARGRAKKANRPVLGV